MNNPDFDELAGRIEGIGTALMLLVETLEKKDMINGKRYCALLRKFEKELCFPGPHLGAAKRTLRETAKALDGARKHRQNLAGQA